MLLHGTMLHSDLQSLTTAQQESDRFAMAFCDSLDRDGLERSIEWANAEGAQCSDPVHVVLAHLFLHQIHPRGQVHQMLGTTSVPPPQLDEFFLSGDAALREAEIHELGLAPQPNHQPLRQRK